MTKQPEKLSSEELTSRLKQRRDVCPYCGDGTPQVHHETDQEADDFDRNTTDAGASNCIVECLCCGNAWFECYQFKDAEPIDD
jgi:hypothetical protein